ncbi:putative MerR family transcriptional regulator [Streptomyces sp. Tu6071]|nr:putative MerR family transcriptional regulator [Streptomyces sp. Tu6071]
MPLPVAPRGEQPARLVVPQARVVVPARSASSPIRISPSSMRRR